MFLLMVIGFIICFLIRGIVLVTLWKWFIVPFGIMPITFWHGLGIAGIIGYLTYHQTPKKEDKDVDFSRAILISITFSIITLFFGWIFHSFM